jgi:hypothetical protein
MRCSASVSEWRIAGPGPPRIGIAPDRNGPGSAAHHFVPRCARDTRWQPTCGCRKWAATTGPCFRPVIYRELYNCSVLRGIRESRSEADDARALPVHHVCPHWPRPRYLGRAKRATCRCRKRWRAQIHCFRLFLSMEKATRACGALRGIGIAMSGAKLNSPPRARRGCGCPRRRRTPSASPGSSWPTCAASPRPRCGRAP